MHTVSISQCDEQHQIAGTIRAYSKRACPRNRTAYRLDEFPILKQLGLVLNVATRNPCLNLITQSLQLLYLSLEVGLQFLFLSLVCRRLHFVVDALKELYTFRDLL